MNSTRTKFKGFLGGVSFLTLFSVALGTMSAEAQTSSVVYYSRVGSPDGTIWKAATDGSFDEPITTGNWPRLSPDGGFIVFHRGSHPDPVRKDLWVRDLQTGDEMPVFTHNDFAVSYDWTGDSSQIVFDFACSIFVMNRDGTNILPLIQVDCFDDAPALSPIDGTIAFHNIHVGILVADADGRNRRVVPNTMPNDVWPQWSPDGQWMSFGRSDGLLSIVNYYKIRPDGTELTQLTFLSITDPDRFAPNGPWTQDGSTLVAPGTLGGVQGLYAIATDGSGAVTLLPTTPGAVIDFAGSVQPIM